jgi:hypothetical protein
MYSNTSSKQSSPILPNQLRVGVHTLNRAGPGRAPGSVLYLDLARGKTVELYAIHIVTTGEHYSVAAVSGNTAIDRLLLSHPIPGVRPPVVGNVYLAQLDWIPGSSPSVSHLWPLIEHPAPKSTPAPVQSKPRESTSANSGKSRYTGSLKTVVGDKAYIHEDATGRIVSLDPKQLLENIPWKEGVRVSFERIALENQWVAKAVLPA